MEQLCSLLSSQCFHNQFTMDCLLVLTLSLWLAVAASAQIVFFPFSSRDGTTGNPVDIPAGFGSTALAVSLECATALNATVNCNPRLQGLAAGQYYGTLNGSESTFCEECRSSLVQYHDQVSANCAGTTVWIGTPNTRMGDIIWAWYNRTCQFDSNGRFCPGTLDIY